MLLLSNHLLVLDDNDECCLSDGPDNDATTTTKNEANTNGNQDITISEKNKTTTKIATTTKINTSMTSSNSTADVRELRLKENNSIGTSKSIRDRCTTYCTHGFSTEISHCVHYEDVESSDQVAGHGGFYRCKANKYILKPITLSDIRSRRERYFYQLLSKVSSSSTEDDHYHNIDLFKNRDISDNCYSCKVDKQVLLRLIKHVPKYYGTCRLIYPHSDEEKCMSEMGVGTGDEHWPGKKNWHLTHQNMQSSSSEALRDISSSPTAKHHLFMTIEDLTAHCKTPCVIDIKIGIKTYDPNATKEKIEEESSKYSKLSEFGFRILGMRVTSRDGRVILSRDKQYGKTLMTSVEIARALNSFFDAIESKEAKCKTVNKVIGHLVDIESWFSNYNIGQLQFISSSILIVYDPSAVNIEQSVRVALIDFAHVFHLHPINSSKDESYLFGLRKLIELIKYQSTAAVH